MWKVFAGFIAFALLALFVIMKGGDKVDMQGEAGAHNPTETTSSHAPAAPANSATGSTSK